MTGRTGRLVAVVGAVAAVSGGLGAGAAAQSRSAGGPLRIPRADRGRAPLATPSQRAANLVAASLTFRRASGLRTDLGFVRGLVAQRGQHRTALERFGVPLTSAELAALDARQRVDALVPALERQAAAEAPGSFAGLYVDQRAGGVVRVGFTRDAADQARRLRTRSRFPGRIEAFAARYPDGRLRALAHRVGVDPARGVVMVAPDVAHQAVEVGVIHPTPALGRSLARRYPGVPIRMVATPAPRALASESYADYPAPPMRGALEMYRPSSAFTDTVCSAGFVSEGSNNPQNFWLLTAGHCGPYGATWSHDTPSGTYHIGRSGGNVLRSGSDADAQDITLSPAARSRQVYLHDYDLRVMSYQQRYDTDYVGEPVCHAGVGSYDNTGEGTACGYLQQKDATVALSDGTTSYTLYHQRIASLRSCAGDSGGPIFKLHTGLGILSGGEGGSGACGPTTTYSHIGHVTRDLHVHLYGAAILYGAAR